MTGHTELHTKIMKNKAGIMKEFSIKHTYEVVSKIFQTGAAIYTAVVVV
jgi:hypothetical protein